MEIGSGSGNFATLFIQDGLPLRLSDPDHGYCKSLYKKFEGIPLVKGIYKINPLNENFETKYPEILGRLDTVFYLNTLGHFPTDSKVIGNCKKLLRTGGYLMLLIPVSTAIYQESDEEGYEAWRNINLKNIRQLLTNDFEIRKTHFFKVLGHVGWYLYNKIIPSKKASIYHEKVPLFLGVDEIVFHRTGLSVIVIAKKMSPENYKKY